MITVVLYKDKGLERSQQMFADLNKHAVNTSKSLNTLYDVNSPIALSAKQVLDQVPFYENTPTKRKITLPNMPQKYVL